MRAGSSADWTSGLLALASVLLTALIAVLLAVMADAVWERWRSRGVRNLLHRQVGPIRQVRPFPGDASVPLDRSPRPARPLGLVVPVVIGDRGYSAHRGPAATRPPTAAPGPRAGATGRPPPLPAGHRPRSLGDGVCHYRAAGPPARVGGSRIEVRSRFASLSSLVRSYYCRVTRNDALTVPPHPPPAYVPRSRRQLSSMTAVPKNSPSQGFVCLARTSISVL